MSQERDNTVYWTRQKVVLSLVLSSRTNSTNGSCSDEEKQGMHRYAADMMSRPARFSFSDTPEMHVDARRRLCCELYPILLPVLSYLYSMLCKYHTAYFSTSTE